MITDIKEQTMITRQDPFMKGFNSYKTNLHAHSTTSDGSFSATELIKLYRDNGYDILALSDHFKINDIEALASSGINLLSSMEIHPKGPNGGTLHIVALNVPADFEDPSSLPWQEAINLVIDAGGECIIAHPYWTGNDCHEILKMENLLAVEVYNHDTRFKGRAGSEVIWDQVLQHGRNLGAVAVDDTHSVRDLFGGWTMISAPDPSSESIMNSLREGLYYATTGPEFHQIQIKENKFSVKCSPVEELLLIGPPAVGIVGTIPGYKAKVTDGTYIPAAHETVTSFEAEIPESIAYIRCRIKDCRGHYAWTNAFFC